MATTITYADGTITPTSVEGFESERMSGNVVHPIPNRPNPDVTMRPAGLRTGRLRMLFTDTATTQQLVILDGIVQSVTITAQDAETASKVAEDAHANIGIFTLAPDGRPSLAFSYVPSGRILRRLDPDTGAFWVVEVEFQEVIP